MRSFELFVEILHKVEVQADTIEQAEQILRKQLEDNPKSIPGTWKIIIPKEAPTDANGFNGTRS